MAECEPGWIEVHGPGCAGIEPRVTGIEPGPSGSRIVGRRGSNLRCSRLRRSVIGDQGQNGKRTQATLVGMRALGPAQGAYAGHLGS